MTRIVAALALSTACLIPNQAEAQRLPTMEGHPWLGFFSGYKRRSFEFGVSYEGQCELYLMNDSKKERVGNTRTVKIYAEVLVENAEGKVFAKRLKEDEGLATELKAGLDHKEVKFTAESTGDAKVEITVKYDRDRIIMDGKVLDPGTLKEEKIYLGFKVMVPPMYSNTYDSADEKKLKSAMRKDRIRFVRAKDGKRVSLKSYEELDLSDEKMAQGGVTSLQVAMEGQEGNDFIFSTLDGTGVIDFENRYKGKKGALWKGYYVKWKRLYVKEPEVNEDKKSSGSRGSSKKKEGVTPLVIEIK